MSNRHSMKRVILVALVVLAAFPHRAHADKVSDFIGQLKNGEDKIRLSAALALSKSSDSRAVQPLIDALEDSDRNVRAAAAIGLGKVITAKTDSKLRAKAVTALTAKAKKDSNSIVKKNAQASADTISAIDSDSASSSGSSSSSSSSSSSTVAKGGVYVNIGPMDAKGTGADAKLKTAMRSTTSGTFGKSAKSMATTWPGGKDPKQSELDAKG